MLGLEAPRRDGGAAQHALQCARVEQRSARQQVRAQPRVAVAVAVAVGRGGGGGSGAAGVAEVVRDEAVAVA